MIPRHSPKLGTNQGDAKPDDELLLRWWWYPLDELSDQFPQVLNLEGEGTNQLRVVLDEVHDHVRLWIPALVILFLFFPLGVFFSYMVMDKGMEGTLGAWRRCLWCQAVTRRLPSS